MITFDFQKYDFGLQCQEWVSGGHGENRMDTGGPCRDQAWFQEVTVGMERSGWCKKEQDSETIGWKSTAIVLAPGFSLWKGMPSDTEPGRRAALWGAVIMWRCSETYKWTVQQTATFLGLERRGLGIQVDFKVFNTLTANWSHGIDDIPQRVCVKKGEVGSFGRRGPWVTQL